MAALEKRMPFANYGYADYRCLRFLLIVKVFFQTLFSIGRGQYQCNITGTTKSGNPYKKNALKIPLNSSIVNR